MLKQGSLQQKFSYNEVGEVLKHLRHREPERTFTKELVQVGLLDPAKPQRLYRKAWREVEEFANNLELSDSSSDAGSYHWSSSFNFNDGDNFK